MYSEVEFQSYQLPSFLHKCFLGPDDSNHKSGQYFCDECDVNFDKSTAYARHLYAHTFIKKVSFIYVLRKHKEKSH